MTYYTLEAIEKLIGRYIEKGGEVVTIREGSLGYGTTLLHGPGLKTAIIQERYISAWSSSHTVRLYNQTPAKYTKLMEDMQS